MQTLLVLTQGITADQFISEIRPVTTDPNLSTQRLANYLKGQSGGNYTSGISTLMTIDSAAATATLTFTGAPTAAQTFVLLGTTFTAVASGATGNQFNIGATITETATNVVTAVNASATALVTRNVVASSVAGVVTFTAIVPGTVGNFLTLTEGLTNATAVNFASGTDGTNTFTFNML